MPTVTIAHKTLAEIDRRMQADQGGSYRGLLGRVLPHIGDAYREEEDGFRSHLGASLLGGDCNKSIWFSFRWATKGKFDGRILRLFNRGHLEEGRIIALLLMIGCQVYQQDGNGNQFRISWAEGHAGGSGDGIVGGLPDLKPEQYALSEFKTHSEKSFVELAGKLPEWRAHLLDPVRNPFTGKGVRDAKPEHYVQMQSYMRKMGLAVALYVAVCKNTDDLYMELVPLNTEFADQYLDKGERLVWAEEAPQGISKSPGFWKCKFCDHKPVCHEGAEPERNCRTCDYVKPAPGGEWHCTKVGLILSKDEQLAGCDDYTRHRSI